MKSAAAATATRGIARRSHSRTRASVTAKRSDASCNLPLINSPLKANDES